AEHQRETDLIAAARDQQRAEPRLSGAHAAAQRERLRRIDRARAAVDVRVLPVEPGGAGVHTVGDRDGAAPGGVARIQREAQILRRQGGKRRDEDERPEALLPHAATIGRGQAAGDSWLGEGAATTARTAARRRTAPATSLQQSTLPDGIGRSGAAG